MQPVTGLLGTGEGRQAVFKNGTPLSVLLLHATFTQAGFELMLYMAPLDALSAVLLLT